MRTDEIRSKILQLMILNKETSYSNKHIIGDLLTRIKEPINVEDEIEYNRVTIRTKNKGISVRDTIVGVKIGTKRQFLVKEGLFLLSKIDARNGAFGIAPEEIEGAIVTNDFLAYKVNDILLDIKWFNLYVSTNYFIDICQKSSFGSTNRKRLKEENFLSFEIDLPSLDEQKLIVEKIENIFLVIDELSKNEKEICKSILETRNKIYKLAIQGKLLEQNDRDVPAQVLVEKIKEEKERLIKEKKIKKEKVFPEITEEEKLFDLPKGWKWCRLGDIGIYKKGPFGSTITKSMFVPKGNDTIKVYEQKNAIQKDWTLGEYYVTKEYFEQKLKGFEVFEDEIIVSCAGTIGETYIMPKEIERGVINQALMKMKLYNGINVDYFLMYFDSILKDTAKDSSKGSAMKNIPPFEVFKKMLFALPPIEEQKRIVDKVNEIMNYLDTLENTILVNDIV